MNKEKELYKFSQLSVRKKDTRIFQPSLKKLKNNFF